MSTPGFRDLAWRLVAGEDLAAGVAAVRALNADKIGGSLNALGMHVTDEGEARTGAAQAIAALERIHGEGLGSHVSIKLTAIGLEISEELCREQLQLILDHARATGVFVRIDMEESPYVEATVRLYEEMADRFGNDEVGIVIQSYLRNPPYDLRDLAARGARIRLVKGGYREGAAIAIRDRAEIDAAFRRDIETLLRVGSNPAIATHDTEAIVWAAAVARHVGLPTTAFEFQMLYGVRTDLQHALASSGYQVRAYVPYGGTWLTWLLLAAHAAWHRAAGRVRRRSGTGA
jgi:proline dehydrogenase